MPIKCNIGAPISPRSYDLYRGVRDHRMGFSSWDKAILHMLWRRCVYCESLRGPFHLDHITPICAGGLDEFENLTLACATCNSLKQGRGVKDVFPHLPNLVWLEDQAYGHTIMMRGALRGSPDAMEQIEEFGLTVAMLRRSRLVRSTLNSDVCNLVDHVMFGHLPMKGADGKVCVACGQRYEKDVCSQDEALEYIMSVIQAVPASCP